MKLLLALMLSSLPGLASAANLVKLGTDSKCILGKCDEFDHIQSLLISHKLWIDGQKHRRSTRVPGGNADGIELNSNNQPDQIRTQKANRSPAHQAVWALAAMASNSSTIRLLDEVHSQK